MKRSRVFFDLREVEKPDGEPFILHPTICELTYMSGGTRMKRIRAIIVVVSVLFLVAGMEVQVSAQQEQQQDEKQTKPEKQAKPDRQRENQRQQQEQQQRV